MFLHLVIGLGCMFVPDLVSKWLALPPPVPKGWIVGWGATLILVTALYVPGLRDPVGARYPNWCGIGGRVWMATVWFVIGGGLSVFGVFDAAFAAILALFYYRLLSAVDSPDKQASRSS
jgi:membrane protein implicated in regulation of membrane protease activity